MLQFSIKFLAVLLFAVTASPAVAGLLDTLFGTATSASRTGEPLANAVERIKALAPTSDLAPLAAAASHDGHWRLVNRAGETMTAANPEELARALNVLAPEMAANPKARLAFYLTEDTVFLNDRLAKFYGVEPPKGGGFAKSPLDAGKRLGTLTHPYLLANYAYTSESSPIHRGVFLARGVLGLTLKPPNEAFTPFAADLHPGLSTRERTALQTSPRACQQCHGLINPLGFALESFDAAGRYRDTERGKPLDASGSYLTRTGEVVKFAGAVELAKFLAGSPEVHDSFAEQAFHHLAQQPIRAYGPRKLAELREAFAAANFDIRTLAVEIAVTAAAPPGTLAAAATSKK